jgi:hypothetical protein
MLENHSQSAAKRSHSDEALNEATLVWLARLPRNVKPKALVQRFPRIVNQIAALWGDPTACDRYLEQLVFDTRDNTRTGFPPEMAFEIAYLKAMVSDIIEARKKALNPKYVNVWDGLDR